MHIPGFNGWLGEYARSSRKKAGTDPCFFQQPLAPSMMEIENNRKPGKSESRFLFRRKRVDFFAVATATPMFFYQVLFFLGPLLYIVILSFFTVEWFQIKPIFTTANWIHIWQQDFFWAAFWRSLLGSALTAVIVTLVAFPVALYLGVVASPGHRLMWLGILIMPYFTNYVIRIFTWRGLLGEQGPINQVVSALGFARWQLVDSLPGVVVGYVTLTLPLVLILQTFSLAYVDKTLIQAALNLGASPRRVLFRVIIPAAKVGIILGAAFAFVLAFGDFLSPAMIGANRPPVLSGLLVDQIRAGNHWPRASVVAISMFLFLFLIVLIAVKSAYRARRGGK